MTSIYTENGTKIAVTKCKALPLKVTQVNSDSIQIAYGSKKHLDKATSTKLDKLKLEIKPQHFKEFKLISDKTVEVGNDIAIDSVFEVGESIDATGTSKGRGFAGVIKRHGFQRQPVSGGQSDRTRAPGAIGAQTPGKVVRGKKMPGHMGNKAKTVTNLKVVGINTETQEILISGSIPGSINSWITLKKQ